MGLTLIASDVAACICKHPYKPRSEVALKILKRAYPEVYRKQCDAFGYKDDDMVMAMVQEKRPDVVQYVQRAAEATTTSRAVGDNISTVLSNVFSMELSDGDKTRVQQCIQKKFNTSLGINNESSVIEELESRIGEQIICDDVLHKTQMGVFEGEPWFLCGKVDGVTESGTIIEVKNRTKRLFNRVPSYELIQVYCYMHLLSSHNAIVAECYDGQIKTYDIDYKDSEWKKIHDGLQEFVVYMSRLLTDEEEQRLLFKTMT